jgi:hypothetical protein
MRRGSRCALPETTCDTRREVSQEQPPRQLSPDGKYYWDGQRWVPVEQQQMVPSTPGAQPMTAYRPATNGLAVASLVFGIISWFMCPLVGGVVAIITGHVAHGQIRRTGESGNGMATAGLVLGYIHIAALVLTLAITIVVLGGLAALLVAIGAASPTPSP